MSKLNVPFDINGDGNLTTKEQRTYDAELLTNIQMIESSLATIANELVKLNSKEK